MRCFGILLVLCVGSLSALRCPVVAAERVTQWGGQSFAAGENVRVSARGADDLFAAGGDVWFDGASGDHLFAAGGQVTFRDVSAHDLMAAGGSLSLAGRVDDDVLMAGGRVVVSKDGTIGDSALLAGRQIFLEGKVRGPVWAAAEVVTVTGEVGGDLVVQAERLVIAQGARVGGNLSYSGPREATISPDATIVGSIHFVRREGAQSRWRPHVAVAGIATLLAMAVLAAALQGAVPRLLTTAAATVAERPWASLGLGFAVLVAVPVAVGLLFISVVGMPLALVVLLAYLTVLMPALIVFAYWLGVSLGRMVGWGMRERGWGARWGWTVVGIVVLGLVGVLPWIGGTAMFIALVFGLGALVAALFRHLRRPVDFLPPG